MSNANTGGRGTLHEDGISSPAELPAVWRARAEILEQNGAEGQATAIKRCAEQLELALNCQGDVLLTTDEAAALSGYSRDHLRKLIRTGKIPSSGTPRRLLVRQADLPRRPRQVASSSPRPYDAHADACRLRHRAKTRAL